jgi:hemerythrin
MKWSDEYATGIADIDNDHQILFMFVNDLHDKFVAGASDDDLATTLSGLVNYVNVHFVREESLMADAGYEDLEDHAEAHRRLSARVFALKEQFDDRPGDFNREAFLEFLKGWLTSHILYTDMNYVPALRESAPPRMQ